MPIFTAPPLPASPAQEPLESAKHPPTSRMPLLKVEVAAPVEVAKLDPTFRMPQNVVEPVLERFTKVVVADIVELAINRRGEPVANN